MFRPRTHWQITKYSESGALQWSKRSLILSLTPEFCYFTGFRKIVNDVTMKKKSLIKSSCSHQGLTGKSLNIRNLELSFRGNEASYPNWVYNYCLEHFELSKTWEYEESLTKSYRFVEGQSGRRCRWSGRVLSEAVALRVIFWLLGSYDRAVFRL